MIDQADGLKVPLPPWALVLLASLMMNACLVMVFGIGDGGDSGRYYDSAEKLLGGELPTGKARSYLGYSLFVTPFVMLGLGAIAIGVAQILLSGLAAVCLYFLGARFYGTRAGLLAAALYIAFPDIQYWNLIIYAESVFSSMLLISSYLLLTATNRKRAAVALVLAAYTCTIRPHGVGFAAALMLFALYLLWTRRNYKLLAALALAGVVAAPALWSTVGAMARHERVLDTYAGGEVIWGYKDNALDMPGDISDRTMDIHHPVLAIGAFAVEKPVYFLNLILHKLFYLYAHVRPYFSGFHNLLSLAFLIPVYLFALPGVPADRDTQRPPRALLLASFFCQSLVTALTFTDWDGRFLIPLLHVPILFAAVGFWRCWGRVRIRRRNRTLD